MVGYRKNRYWKVLAWLLLCVLFCMHTFASAEYYTDSDGSEYTIESDGSKWYKDGRIIWPDGSLGQQEDDGSGDPASSTSQNGGKEYGDTSGIGDTLSGIQQNADGSITIESGQGGVDIEVEPTRAPLTAEEWEDLLKRAEDRNGNYTPTFYRDPATGAVTEVQVVYMGIGRSMITLNGQETLVNTVDLTWATEAPEDKVLAVIDTPKNGYAWLRMKPNNKITTAKIGQCRLDKVVRVISTGKNWTFIDYDGMRGYVQTSSLEFFANDHTNFQTGLLSVKGKTSGRETCNIRSRDEKHRVLTDYPQGTPVTVFDVIEEFAQIDICGWHCTVNTKFLTMEKEIASAD